MTATNLFSEDGMTENSPWRLLKSTPLVFQAFIAGMPENRRTPQNATGHRRTLV